MNGIYVHALKSSSRSIGAVKLSQLAAKAETAAKDGDTLTIDKYHPDMIRMYSRIAHIIDEHVNPLAANEKADEEVLEFEPS